MARILIVIGAILFSSGLAAGATYLLLIEPAARREAAAAATKGKLEQEVAAVAAWEAADLEEAKASETEAAEVFLEQVRAAVRRMLKDPDSAKFSELSRVSLEAWELRSEYMTEMKMRVIAETSPVDVVCGKVHAKNSFGGDVGAASFVYIVAERRVLLDHESTRTRKGADVETMKATMIFAAIMMHCMEPYMKANNLDTTRALIRGGALRALFEGHWSLEDAKAGRWK